MTQTNIYTVDPAKKKDVLVGVYDSESNTLILRKDKAKHFMRVVDGYGMQEDVYERARKKNCYVLIKEKGGATYQSHITGWAMNGKSADYGNGKQKFLSLKYMKQI